MINHYKSWSGLNKQLTSLLCDELKGHLYYFLTRYHQVHNSYGRAAIRLDKRELCCFSWIEMYNQERDVGELYEKTGVEDYCDPDLKKKWDDNATYHDMDFISAATTFLQEPVMESLYSENFLIRIFAIIDRRIGKRTLQKIREQGEYTGFPDWVKQFYELRLNAQ